MSNDQLQASPEVLIRSIYLNQQYKKIEKILETDSKKLFGSFNFQTNASSVRKKELSLTLAMQF